MDAQNDEALRGANVVLRHNDTIIRGSATDGDGFFAFNDIASGVYALQASFLGYVTSRDSVTLAEGEIRTIRVFLRPSEESLGEIVVESNREDRLREAESGLIEIRPPEIERVPSPDVSGDLATYLQTLPGVVSSGDRGGQLYIRGGTPSQNLVLLDGIPIFQPFHMIGFFSAFPSDVIHHTDLYPGAFQAEFGGRTSSVVDVATRNGSKSRHSATVTVAPFLSSIGLEGPLAPQRTSFLLSVRESLIERLIPGRISNLPFLFGDLLAKVHSDIGGSGQVSVTAMQTHDRGVVDESERVPSAFPNTRVVVPDDEVRWRNQAIGLRYLMLPPSMPVLGELTVSYSKVYNAFGTPGAPDRTSSVDNFRASAVVSRIRGAATLRWGMAMQNQRIKYSLDGVFQDLDDADEPRLDAGFFYELSYRLRGRTTARAGIHSHLYAGSGLTVEPRIRLSWQVVPGGSQVVNIGWGLYSQNLIGLQDERDAGDVFTAWLPSPLKNSIAKSMHFALGYQADLPYGISLNADGYLKSTANLPVPQWTPFARFTTSLVSADADAYGLETSLRWSSTPYFLAATWSVSNVTYTASQESFGVWYGTAQESYHPPHDRRHQLNLLGSLKHGRLGVGLRWQLGSGLPFTRPIGFDDWIFFDSLVDVTTTSGQYRVLFERPYQGRLPAYHRLDVSVDLALDIASHALTVKGGIINVYDRDNLFYFDVWSLRRVNQMGILPWVGIKLDI
ncbi:MAG: TonB-dependent receptor [Bacteroidetes bacterium]|nr:TonB-dependent receptor [Bacteroidota bacterium]